MSRRSGVEPARKPTAVRQREIVDAAIRIIAVEGPRQFTAKRLAADVGVTSGAIFRHFESMGAIVDAAIEHMDATLSADFPPPEPDAIASLAAFFLNRTRTIRTHPLFVRLLLFDHLRQTAGPAQVERLEALKKRSRAFVIGCLREAERSGALSKEISPEAGAVIVVGAILSLSHVGTRVVQDTSMESLSDEVWMAIERTLRPRDRARVKE